MHLGDASHLKVSAVAEMEAVVALEESTGHPDLAADRAELERLRARRT